MCVSTKIYEICLTLTSLTEVLVIVLVLGQSLRTDYQVLVLVLATQVLVLVLATQVSLSFSMNLKDNDSLVKK